MFETYKNHVLLQLQVIEFILVEFFSLLLLYWYLYFLYKIQHVKECDILRNNFLFILTEFLLWCNNRKFLVIDQKKEMLIDQCPSRLIMWTWWRRCQSKNRISIYCSFSYLLLIVWCLFQGIMNCFLLGDV